MRVGIVGSREFGNLDLVKDLVLSLEKGDVVVSGGARGTDRTAVDYAKFLGLGWDEKLPDIPPSAPKWVAIQALFARNTLIAEACDELHAFINLGLRSNGTFDTVTKAARLGRLIFIHYSDGSLRDFNFPAPPTKKRLEQLVYHWEAPVTVTGRLNTKQPNLSNIPVRTPEGAAIRQAFLKTYDELEAEASARTS